MDVFVKRIDFVIANERCKCGNCNHTLLRIEFSNDTYWFPKIKELQAIKEMFGVVAFHNINNDKYCFKSDREKNIGKVLK